MCVIAVLALVGIVPGAARPALADAPPEPAAIERTIPTQVQQKSAAPLISPPAHDVRSPALGHTRFTLGAVSIDGATVFSRGELSRYVESYLATEVDEGRLAQMASAITARYLKTGYLLSYATIPSQNVEAGMVRLAVVEGRIDRVSVQGAGAAEGAIEAIAAPLVKDGPLKNSTLERALGLIRDFPGLKVTDVALMRSDIEAGLYTLRVTVIPDRTRAFTYLDNRGTGSIGKSRIYNSFAISSLALPGDELRLDLFAMPGGRSRYLYGQAFAASPIGHHGMRLSVAASRGDQYLRAEEHFVGQSTNVTGQLSYPVLRSRKLTMVAKASLTDWRSVGRQHDLRRLRDRLRAARFGFDLSNEGKTRFQAELLISRGLGFGQMTRVGDPLASRLDASGRFTKATFALQLSRSLSERLALRTVAAAQYSDRPLLSAEEFSLGGNRIGRAFEFNTRTGDRGLGGGLELSYRLGNPEKSRLGLELFGFADGGVAKEIKSSTTAARSRSLGSAGVGTRFSIARTTFSLEAGIPLSGADHRTPRLFVSAFRSF